MSNPFYTRRRTIGRAASPPTWACYEQIRYEDEEYSDSDSDSCSEDDEDYSHRDAMGSSGDSDVSDDIGSGDNSIKPGLPSDTQTEGSAPAPADGGLEMEMEMGDDTDKVDSQAQQAQKKKDLKGKQKAVDPPEPEPQPTRNRRHTKKRRQQMYTLRPILTIQRSQGFVWNQDLFVPPYIKDRYIASTSPPNARGFVSTSVSSTNSAMTDYEVEVVEIRIQEDDIRNIIP